MPQNRYWNLAGQTVAIVASILLAFGIQAWWQESQEKDDAERLLSSILAEYKSNVGAVKIANQHRYSVRDSISTLFSLAAVPEAPDPQIVDDLLGALTWAFEPDVTWGALDALVEGGQITLIENTALRTRLAALHRFKQDFENNGNNDEQLLESVVFPFFFENALLPQIALTPSALRLPGVNGGPSYDHKFKLKTARSHSELLGDSKFLGILMKKLWVQLDSINLNDRFLSDSESLIHLLETEIQRIG